MAYVNFSTIYDGGMGVGPFPYTTQASEISIKVPRDIIATWNDAGPVQSYVIAYDPDNLSKYAVCNTLHPTYDYAYVEGGMHNVLKAQTFDLPMGSANWTFNGGLSVLSKNLALAITMKGYNTPASPAPDGNYWWYLNAIQFDQEVITERYATTIDSCPIHAKRADKDAYGDQIDTTYLKIADMPAIPTAGRNMNLNQYGAMQTNLPGGLFDAPANQSNDFERLNNADFAGAFRLACRHSIYDKYELAIAYTASGMTSSYSFIGTETIIGTDNSVTTKQAVYLAEPCYYTPTSKFGGFAATSFDPTIHKAIIYDGIGQIGPTSDCKIAIYTDANSNVKIAFTAIEVAKVGSTT